MKAFVVLICLIVLAAPFAGAKDVSPKVVEKGGPSMKSEFTNEDAWNLYEKYLTGWMSESEDARKKIIAEVTAEDIQYRTRNHDSGSRPEILEDIATFHKRFPGGHFEIGDVSSHHDVALLTWVIVGADGKEVARGGDQLCVNADGKIVSILTFPPAVKNP